MPSLSSKIFVASANCTFFPLFLVVAQPLLGQSATQAGAAQDQWVSNADELVKELLDLVRNAPEMEDIDMSKDSDVTRAVASSIGGQRLANLQRADKILWKLWLTTGMAPIVRGREKPLPIWLKENALAYQQYLSKHAKLTEEQLQRIGVANTVQSLGSPYWYMTMRYLTDKTGVEFALRVEVHVVPDHFIVETPLTPESYKSLANAMSRWLELNKHRMAWDSRNGRFRPQDGTYLSTDELSDSIAQALTNKTPE